MHKSVVQANNAILIVRFNKTNIVHLPLPVKSANPAAAEALSKQTNAPIVRFVTEANPLDIVEEAKRVLRVESEALRTAVDSLDSSFQRAVELVQESLRSGGKVVTCGVGKSGIVAQKVAATLTSTGSQAVFLHPTEALHGDLGVVHKNDTLLVFSNSGSTHEILSMIPLAKSMSQSTIGVLGNRQGALAEYCDVVITATASVEACPHNLAPTASSTLAMAMGDALAMVLQKITGFSADHFARIHPGGNIGKRLLTKVKDLMHKEGHFGTVTPDTNMEDVIVALTQFNLAGVCVVEGTTASGRPKLAGLIVEGDIRRALKHKEKFFAMQAREIMTTDPVTVTPETKASDALEVMQKGKHQKAFLPVKEEDGSCVGALRVHDLILAELS